MMKTMTRIAVAAAVLALPSVASANHTFDKAHFLPVGGSYYLFMGDSEVQWFAVNLVKGRSYDASAFTVWHEADIDPALDVSWYASDGTAVPPGIFTNDTEPQVVGTTHTGDNDVFIPQTTGTYLVKLTNLSATQTPNVVLAVVETTLFSPYYAVAIASGYDAAPQIKNNTAQSITVFFTAYDSSGIPLAGCPTSGIVLPPNGMTTFGVSGLCGASSAFGGAQVAHTGRLGAVTANITTFSSASGLSFDAAFEIRDGMALVPIWF